MAKQVQVQIKRTTTKRDSAPADAPTTNAKIARTWFGK
jgi:hypothetical protein